MSIFDFLFDNKKEKMLRKKKVKHGILETYRFND